MSSIKYPITLDLKRDYHQVLIMKEGDIDSREIIITITDNGQPFPLDNILVKFKWHKPDHHFVFDDCTIQDNNAVIKCNEQMLIVSGIAKVEIVLYDDSEHQTVLSTMTFHVSIRDSVIDNQDIESSDEFGTLNNLILSNKDLNDSLNQLEAKVEEAENIRISNENTRITNETNRVSAETQRQTDTATAITNAVNATVDADTAAENANTAAKAANTAAKAANTAAKIANSTTQEANTIVETMEALIKNDNLIHTDDLGVANGVATLDENGNIPASQLPGYVDDVLEGHAVDVSLNEEGNAMCASGFILSGETDACIPESGKIYLDTDTNLQYRWTGSIYISTGSVLELGTTSSTAFPGNRGLSLENRVADIEEYHNNIPAQDIKFDNTSTPLLGANVQDALKELSKDATQTSSGLLSADDKKRIDNYANVKTIELLLLSSNWSGSSAPYTQIVPVEQLSCYNNCSIEMPETATAEQENMIANAEINNITYDETIGLTFTATGVKPTIDIPLQLSVGTSMNVVEIPKYFGETPVTGVKGAAETEYRNGNVSLSAEDIGALPSDSIIRDVGNTLKLHSDNNINSINYLQLNVSHDDNNNFKFVVNPCNNPYQVSTLFGTSINNSLNGYGSHIFGYACSTLGNYYDSNCWSTISSMGARTIKNWGFVDGWGYGITFTEAYIDDDNISWTDFKRLGYRIAVYSDSDQKYHLGYIDSPSDNDDKTMSFDFYLYDSNLEYDPYDVIIINNKNTNYSFAQGYGCYAGNAARAMGIGINAQFSYQTAFGKYNNNNSGSIFEIGYGIASNRKNVFRVTTSGQTYASGAYSASGADYSEYFEWVDGNPKNEDRRGYFVTLDGNKIKIADDTSDYILGVVSAQPCVIGNSDDEWKYKYLTDEYGTYLFENIEVEDYEPREVEKVNEDGETYKEWENVKIGSHIEKHPILNPKYDSTIKYKSRANRPEWSTVGFMGVLTTRDDGTCKVNGFACCGSGGIATACEKKFQSYRVLRRINENLVELLIK